MKTAFPQRQDGRIMGVSIMKLQRKQRWGFIIYRTDCSSEADWTEFLARFAPVLEYGHLRRGHGSIIIG